MKMIICLIYIGNLPYYTKDCIHQIRTWSNIPIYFITDKVNQCKLLLEDYDNINYVNYDDILDQNIKVLETIKSVFMTCDFLGDRKHLFYYSFLRLYLLENFMRKYNFKDVFHLEIDNLIYEDPLTFESQFKSKGITYIYEDDKRASAGIFFARDVDSLNHLNMTVLNFINRVGWNSEMVFLGNYANIFKDNVYCLPITNKSSNNTAINQISEKYEEFDNWTFDGSVYGTYLTGIEKAHVVTYGKYCKNPWVNLDITKFSYRWERDNSGRLFPSISSPYSSKIFNLHVHSKELRRYLSKPLLKEEDIVSGERFQELCNISITTTSKDRWHRSLSKNVKRVYIDREIDYNLINNSKIIFVYVEYLLYFMNSILPNINHKFILLTHNEDHEINNSYLPLLESDKVIHMFSQNANITHKKLTPIPIGIANSMWGHGNKSNITSLLNTVNFDSDKKEKIYLNFTIDNNKSHRTLVMEKLKNNSLTEEVKPKQHLEYLNELSNYRWIASPKGNGIDCHRIWEVLYMGNIALVDDTINSKYFKELGLPVILISEWENINLEWLKEQSKNIEYVYDSLDINWWKQKINSYL
jgi:hypothetical protein